MSRPFFRRLFLSLFIACVFLASANPAFAATITVNTTDDELNSDGDCSLREALQTANNNTALTGCVTGQNAPVIDEITIPAGTYTLTIAGINNDTNTTGDLDITQSVILTGAGSASTVIQAGTVAQAGIDRVFQITSGTSKTVTFRHLTIQNGCANNTTGTCSGGGGGIEMSAPGTVTIENAVIQGSRGNAGGGLHPFNGSATPLQVFVSDTICRNNTATVIGGCMSSHNNATLTRVTVTGNTTVNGANGAGIGMPNGTTTLIDSVISGNTSTGHGGGVTIQGYNNGSFGSLIATNSTISGNIASGSGGGIFVNGGIIAGNNYGCSPSACSAILNNVTLAGNTADSPTSFPTGDGGGVFAGTASPAGQITARNSIIEGNSDLTGGVNARPDVSAVLNSQNYNLIGNTTGLTWASAQGSGDLVNVSAALEALADNGGPTMTRALGTGSVALDAGNPAGCSDGTQLLTSDQRGLPRIQNGRCDMGSYELQVTGICGNGTVEGSEQCDDSNTAGGDGCSSACQYETGTCDDGNACTTGETWASGVCGGGSALVCNDNNECTTDSCSQATGCEYSNNANSCSDGNACTTGDTCSAGACVGGGPLSCDDGNGCTTDSCSPVGGCAHSNNTNSCDDGNTCTTNDSCSAGSCAGGAPLNCNDGNGCTDDSCNPATGCAHSNNTDSCSDGNACTTDDACSGGACSGGSPLNCNDNNGCTDDSCNPASGCDHSNNTASCDDGNACTASDQCSGGACSGSGSNCGNGTLEAGCSEECDDNNTANGDGCSSTCQNEPPVPVCGNGAVEEGEECDDNNTESGDGCSSECEAESICGNSMIEEGETCDDGNTANGDCCNALCAYEPTGSSCDDTNTCTATDTCSAGVCSGSGSTCGNGATNGECSEQCDDGGTASGDGCSATCQEEYCGDGSVNNGSEECDDSNVINGDGCDSDCHTEIPADPLAELSDAYEGSSLDAAWANFPVSGGYSSYTVGNGSLNMETPSTFMNPWFQTATGPMLYKSVNSRYFKVTTRLHMRRKAPNESQPMAAGAAQVGGLVLRNPNPGSPNHIVMGMGDMDWSTTNNLQLLNSSTVNGVGLFTNYNRPWLTSPDAEIRVCRVDANFRMYARAVGSPTWELLRSVDRADFPDQIQVGTSVFTTTTVRDTRAVFDEVDFATVSGLDDCTVDINPDSGPGSVCGNDTLESGEQCDGGACCNASCQFATGAVCSDNNACTATDACNASGACVGSGSACGNGTLNSSCGEQCDDNNTVDGDGCDSVCQTEIPAGPVCGNGSVESGEQCDDSNTASGDGCSASCQTEIPGSVCGNGTVESGEQCDDDNTAGGDGCSASCQTETPAAECGNDACEAGETIASCPQDCDGPNLRIQSSPVPTSLSPTQSTSVVTLTYSNIGAAPATGVVITADIPMTANHFSASISAPTVWSCADGTTPGNLCTTTIPGTLAPGASGSVRFGIVFPAAYGRIYHTSTITDDGANGPDADLSDNGASFINSQSYKSVNLGPTRWPANISHMIVPNSYDGTQALPLVIMMHGLESQSYSAQLDGTFGYRFSEAVQTRNYFLILGKGVGKFQSSSSNYSASNPAPHWNATDACCSSIASVGSTPATDVNDVAYIEGLIQEASAKFNVDPNRIYAMGFSNGAFMSYRLACEMPDVLAAIAPISGATYQNEASCAGTEPVSVLHIHGTADPSVPYYDQDYDPDNNPATPNTIVERTNIPGALQTVERWATKAGCDLSSSLLAPIDFITPYPVDSPVGAGSETIVHSYDACDPGYAVELWEVPNWTHGGNYNGGSNPTAATQILDWFFAHPKQ